MSGFNVSTATTSFSYSNIDGNKSVNLEHARTSTPAGKPLNDECIKYLIPDVIKEIEKVGVDDLNKILKLESAEFEHLTRIFKGKEEKPLIINMLSIWSKKKIIKTYLMFFHL